MTSASKAHSVLFIVGPTAIGKTELAIRLAKLIRGEIISCDSMQVYRGMSVLSQAPAAQERRKARHHLIGIMDPARGYSVAIFISEAALLIRSIIKRGRTPMVVGGSGLYVKGLIDGLFPSPPRDSTFRKNMQRFASRYGSKKLHKKLARVDAEAAEKIHPNDTRRIIRALEIYHLTGRTMTELKRYTKGLSDEYKIKIFGLTRSREGIYRNIDSRVEKMFASGMVNEVKRLKTRRLSVTARSVLGFKEISEYLAGEYDLNTAKELLKMNTRRFAKKQLTWARQDKRIRWYDLDEMGEGEVIRSIMKESN